MRKIKYTVILLSLITCLKTYSQTNSTTVSLNQCIEAALKNNPRIKEAENELKIVSSGLKIAQAGSYPLIATELSGGLSDEYRLNQNYKTGSGTLSGEELLWQNGRIKAGIEQAQFELKAEVYSLEAKRLDIIVFVKESYLNCLMQSQLYKTAIGNVSNANLFLLYAREKYRIGAGRKSDVLKAESDFREAQYEQDVFRNSLARSQNELAMLTGLPAAGLSELENFRSYDQQDDYKAEVDTLMAKAFMNYPELMNVNEMQLAQQAKIRQVKAGLFPSLSLNAGYNWNYNPVLAAQSGWFTGMTIRWKIFSGNERHAVIEQEKSKESIYENRRNEIKDFLRKEIYNRLINLKEAISQISLTESMIKTASENLEIAMAQYKAGTGSMLELTSARTDRLDATQKNIRAYFAYQSALVNLERLTENTNQYQY